nr:MAG TPA: Lipopolysaccharide assembly protein A domain [Caudoviricetes sp.]
MKKLLRFAFVFCLAIFFAFSMSAIATVYADETLSSGEQTGTEITGETDPKDEGTGDINTGDNVGDNTGDTTPGDNDIKKDPDPNDIIDGSNLSEEDKNLIKSLIDKVKKYTDDSDSVFIRVYVPMICAGALTLLFGILLILPFFKKAGEAKTVKAMLTNAKKQIDDLKAQVEEFKRNTDVQSIKTDIERFLEDEIARIAALIKDSLAKNDLTINEIDAKTSALVAGAQNAWRGSPEAVDKLTAAPSKTEYEKMKAENDKLWAYVYAKNGENAKKEIEKL